MNIVNELELGFKDVDSVFESTSHRWSDKRKVDTPLDRDWETIFISSLVLH